MVLETDEKKQRQMVQKTGFGHRFQKKERPRADARSREENEEDGLWSERGFGSGQNHVRIDSVALAPLAIRSDILDNVVAIHRQPQ